MPRLETIVPPAEAVSYLVNLALAVSLVCGIGLLAARACRCWLGALATWGSSLDAGVDLAFARRRVAGRAERPGVGPGHDFRPAD